ncbi:DM13 domain-containing protein [Streptomyces sp. 549]|uniref:DM13 domain-containing protein n=1 Tax=Streptomyces sp. 549 TaxID=3049076 RepID=UPI0024C2B6D4|nr:DM13 domain-containing protein [Streptomyces sp. 549]MDK1474852.1 DM13 domain-containing protein [Streptomyces sp. 549]
MSRSKGGRRKPLVLGVLVVGLAAVAVGLYLFQPWKLWTDETVDEALPDTVAVQEPAESPQPPDSPESPGASGTDPAQADPPETTEPAPPSGPTTLATGTFITHEHATSGTAKIIELPDGSRVLRIEDLDTSNGPDLKVWITDAEVKPGRAGWGVFDDGAYLDLGKLKGNKGSQNYALPADADLDVYTSVSIWCARFSVSFGAAELARA